MSIPSETLVAGSLFVALLCTTYLQQIDNESLLLLDLQSLNCRRPTRIFLFLFLHFNPMQSGAPFILGHAHAAPSADEGIDHSAVRLTTPKHPFQGITVCVRHYSQTLSHLQDNNFTISKFKCFDIK